MLPAVLSQEGTLHLRTTLTISRPWQKSVHQSGRCQALQSGRVTYLRVDIEVLAVALQVEDGVLGSCSGPLIPAADGTAPAPRRDVLGA